MIWDLIATIVAGFGGAGIALLIRKLVKQSPRWLIPVFAAAGMFSFQIYSEYQWFSHQKSLLPAGVNVVKSVSERSAWRPWSYLKPQVVRFVAIDTSNITYNEFNSELRLVTLYLFERRSPALAVRQVIHCQLRSRADYTDQLELPAADAPLDQNWVLIAEDETALLDVCQPQA